MSVLGLPRAAVMALAGAVVALAQLNLPSERFWKDQVPLQWGSVLVLAFFILVDAVQSINYSVQAARIREYENDLRAALSATLSSVVTATGAPWDRLVVRYYCHRGVLHRRRLVAVAAVLAGADLKDSQRSISPGEGVVGTAFAEQKTVATEWREFFRTATAQGPQAWERRTKSKRFGLKWGQLRRSPQHEGMVASPTFAENGDPNGCIELSGPLKLIDLASETTQRTLDDLATVLDLLGPPPRGWWRTNER